VRVHVLAAGDMFDMRARRPLQPQERPGASGNKSKTSAHAA
jgi:hypothetical protein